MQNKIDEFMKNKSINWSKRTIRQYRYYLKSMVEWMRLNSVLRIEDVETIDLLNWLESHNTWGSNTKYLAICSNKSFFKWAIGEANSPAEKIDYPKRPIKPQRTLTVDQIEKLLSSMDTSRRLGKRNLALVTLMLDTGLRAIEVCKLTINNLDIENHYLYAVLKGGKWGKGVFGSYTATALAAWMPIRDAIAKNDDKHLFISLGGIKPGTPLTRHGLRAIFRYMGARAKIGLISPHDMRRTFATMALRSGAPSRLVQIAGRWSSINMVERYSQAIMAEDFEPYSPVNHAMGIED